MIADKRKLFFSLQVAFKAAAEIKCKSLLANYVLGLCLQN